MENIQISVINVSTAVSDNEAETAVAALQKQVHRDFAPAWGITADVKFVRGGLDAKPAAGSWWLVIFDDSDQPGALGYHDLTDEGLPLGKVFAGSDKKFGYSWTVTASHELLEMLGDPDINLTVFVQPENSSGGTLYAYEVCDACEADEFGYKIDNVLVSDFVYPAWFESFRKPGSARFDQGANITKPFQLLKGGYIGIYDVNSGNGWTQLTADKRTYNMRARVGSRRERRRTPRSEWMPSTVLDRVHAAA